MKALKMKIKSDIFREEPEAIFTPIDTPVVSSEIKIEGATAATEIEEEVVNRHS